LLEATTRHDALQLLHGYITHEVQVLELRQKISSQAQSDGMRVPYTTRLAGLEMGSTKLAAFAMKAQMNR